MRHRRRGRKLGRSPKHQRALLRNLANALILTERDAEEDDNKPKVKGRIVTTLQKAKEVRPLVERCVTIACRALPHQDAADELEPDAERGSEKWRAWRESKNWHKWNQAVAPAVAARRRVLRLLGNKQAVQILFDEIAPRFSDREGGYTRILQLATPRLGDAGVRAILEFVGAHDRVRKKKAPKPRFEDETEEEPEADEDESEEAGEAEEEAAAHSPSQEPTDAAAETSADDAPDEPASDTKTS
jgi:large subunit ribosomal protein L17